MDEYLYSGFYSRFDTVSKAEGSLLMGPDNIVVDEFFPYFKLQDGVNRAWLKNKFDKEIGYLDVDSSRKIQLAQAREQVIRIILVYVAYSDNPDPGCYWGQVAVFCFNPSYKEEFGVFVDKCADKLSEGIRPKIDLGNSSVQNILSDKNWFPKETVSLPNKEIGFAILKDHRSVSETLIEKGRARNIGCYIVSWIFIIILVIGFAYLLHIFRLF